MPAAGFALSAAIFYVAVKWGYVVPLLLRDRASQQNLRKRHLLFLALLSFANGSLVLLWNAPSVSPEFPYLLFISAIVALVYDRSSLSWTSCVVASFLNSLNVVKFGKATHQIITLLLLIPTLFIAISLRKK